MHCRSGTGFRLAFCWRDTVRNFLWSFSEAQWTSLLIEIAVVCAERAHIFPFSNWHWIFPVWLASSMLLVGIWRHLDGVEKYKLLHPYRVWEIVMALDHIRQSSRSAVAHSDSIHVARTSLGYKFSIREALGAISQCSVSREDGLISLATVRVLARLIGHLDARSRSFTVVPGHAGVFHILFDTPA
jgi:hypothetical protein